jgi:hypothetical protein
VFDLTFYRPYASSAGWRDLIPTRTQSYTLHELVDVFTRHTPAEDKKQVGMYGPHALHDPLPVPCTNPRHEGTTLPHRCDNAVKHLSVAVFDADEGTWEDVVMSRQRISAAGIAQIWHTSHSYGAAPAAKEPWRLLLPLSKPLEPGAWYAFRLELLERFKIPAARGKCSGRSHPWYLPSYPPGHQYRPPKAYFQDGDLLEPPRPKAGATKNVPLPADFRFAPPPETGAPVDLAACREALSAEAARLGRGDEDQKRKARWLRRAIAGEALDEHGNRDEATSRTAYRMVMVLPAAPISTIRYLLRPSVEAMIAAGSSLSFASLDEKIYSAMRAYAENKTREQEILAALAAEKTRFLRGE